MSEPNFENIFETLRLNFIKVKTDLNHVQQTTNAAQVNTNKATKRASQQTASTSSATNGSPNAKAHVASLP